MPSSYASQVAADRAATPLDACLPWTRTRRLKQTGSEQSLPSRHMDNPEHKP